MITGCVISNVFWTDGIEGTTEKTLRVYLPKVSGGAGQTADLAGTLGPHLVRGHHVGRHACEVWVGLGDLHQVVFKLLLLKPVPPALTVHVVHHACLDGHHVGVPPDLHSIVIKI